MRITLNNREEVFDRDVMTVSDMITIRNFSFRMKIIKINGKLISRDQYDSTYINDGDNVQMFYLMSGG
ncbi:MAG TPA: sulfur carrier protein ThiS [Bacteroidales bacterium]|jgi:thiamine biosynthesis protein ThiS|nr:sulfur carrier protein ThiS [Bacteroidales bacterium]